LLTLNVKDDTEGWLVEGLLDGNIHLVGSTDLLACAFPVLVIVRYR
jgi:hypothetical protein